MKIRFWGVRGSIAAPGPDTAVYGGNTSCYEVRNAAGDLAILDAGTGIRAFGMSLLGKGKVKASILISHTHWDHIQGFPFFVPAFIPGNELSLYAPVQFEKTLQQIIAQQMDYSVFPVRSAELLAEIRYHNLPEGPFAIPGFSGYAKFVCHPVTTAGYRLEADDKSVVYTGDHERFFDQVHKNMPAEEIDPDEQEAVAAMVDMQNAQMANFCRNADVLIADSMYLDKEYPTKMGWGHSTVEMNIRLAIEAGVKHLVLSHHDPLRKDADLDGIATYARQLLDESGGQGIALSIAREGLVIEL